MDFDDIYMQKHHISLHVVYKKNCPTLKTKVGRTENAILMTQWTD